LLKKLKAYILEHHFFSLFRLNFHKVDENLYRSAQPTPKQIEKLKKKYNIKTIINLRGPQKLHMLDLERETCNKLGINLIEINFHSRGIPSKEKINEIYKILKTIKYPALIHCKSGSDRTGLVAVLYLFLIKKVPLKKALKHLNFLPFGHIKYSKAGKIDYFFEKFLEFHKNHPEIDFLKWVNNYMDKQKLDASFYKEKNHILDFLNDKILKRE